MRLIAIGTIHAKIIVVFICRRTKFIELRESMGLLRTRKQGHSVEDIRLAMQRLRIQYPKAGMREIKSLLFHEEGMQVARWVELWLS